MCMKRNLMSDPILQSPRQGTVHTDLFDTVELGEYRLANRVVMAPLTRSRASAQGVPTSMMAEYYAQRASAGLIIAEGTNVSPQGRGYALTPGIYTTSQVEGWRRVTEAIHGKGSRVFVQLWHVGRISHPSLQPNGALPVAPSAICPEATSFTAIGFQSCLTPRALATEEIPEIVAQYVQATRNALLAGFDGVEIHAANGYLIEQFLRDSTNRRTDVYGGSREKRARFLLEVTEAVVSVCGASRVGVRLSPVSTVNGIGPDSDPLATFSYVVEQLNALKLAYLHVIEGITQGPLCAGRSETTAAGSVNITIELTGAPPAAQSAPAIYGGGVVNAANFMVNTLPGGGIAQGSIFTILDRKSTRLNSSHR